jgi:hypothetical protein
MNRANIKKSMFFTAVGAVIVTAFSLSTMESCKKNDTPVASGPTLYDSLGGTTLVQDPTAANGVMIEKGRLAIRSVIDSTIFIVAADNQINDAFAVLLAEVGNNNFTGYTALTNNFTDFMCVAAGAKNFTYGGRSMSDAHNPAYNPRMTGKASASDFNEFVNDVVQGANKNAVPSYLITSVGKLLATTQSAVVQQ